MRVFWKCFYTFRYRNKQTDAVGFIVARLPQRRRCETRQRQEREAVEGVSLMATGGSSTFLEGRNPVRVSPPPATGFSFALRWERAFHFSRDV